MDLAKTKTQWPKHSIGQTSIDPSFINDVTFDKIRGCFAIFNKFTWNALLVTLLLTTTVYAASEESAEDESARWFEVEVILYKSASEDGVTNESWSKDVKLTLPPEKIDFLQPFTEPEPETALDPELNTELSGNPKLAVEELVNKAVAAETISDANNLPDSPQESPVEETGLTLEEESQEQPFLPLEKAYLQLSDEAQRIDRNRHFVLISHFAWRQPVSSRKEGSAVRIAGGKDHSEVFDYTGTKKLEEMVPEMEVIDDELLEDSGLEIPTKQELELETDLAATDTIAQQGDADNEALLLDSPITDSEQEFIPVALPWVPEIDGSLMVYIYRNYLHVDADLYYRRPGKEEISALSLSNNFSTSATGFETSTSKSEHSTLSFSQRSLEDIDAEKSIEPINIERATDIPYKWQFDSDFLNRESEQVYLTRLINYPLKQTRRLRSGELHYFDHPLIGMLVIIRPYELTTETENELEIDSVFDNKAATNVTD